MIVEARPSTLLDVASEVAKAEEHTIMRFEEARGKDTPNPSVRKSETGAIDRVELYGPADRRSEEHTSELQSLIRISYAVFFFIQNIFLFLFFLLLLYSL